MNWTIEELGRYAGVNGRTVIRFEQTDDVPSGRISTISAVQAALEAAGVEFVGTPDDGPGIRLRRRKSK